MRKHLDVLFLVLFVLAVNGTGLFWNVHTRNAEQAAQRQAGVLVERKLCTDLLTMADLQPPAGSAAANPSRAYEQAEHRAWSGLVQAIGCKGPP